MRTQSPLAVIVCALSIVACGPEPEAHLEEPLETSSGEVWKGQVVTGDPEGVVKFSSHMTTCWNNTLTNKKECTVNIMGTVDRCTGVVFQKKWILTSKHCFSIPEHTNAKAFLGESQGRIARLNGTGADLNKIHFPADPLLDLAIIELPSPYLENGKALAHSVALSSRTPETLATNASPIISYGYGPNSNITNDQYGTLRKARYQNKPGASETTYKAYYDQVSHLGGPMAPFGPSVTCEGTPSRYGMSCNWMANPVNAPGQDQMGTPGDSGGPCFLGSTDWHDKGTKPGARELVGINQRSWGPQAYPATQAWGSTFSVNIAYAREWIESVTMAQGGTSSKQGKTAAGEGIQWIADLDGDGSADYIKVQANKIGVTLSDTVGQFVPPTSLWTPFAAPEQLYLTYLNGDSTVDFIYLTNNSLSALVTDYQQGVVSVSPQVATSLPAISPGDWLTDAKFLAPLSWTPTSTAPYSLVRVATNKLVTIPNTGSNFNPALAKTSTVECPGGSCAGISEYYDATDVNGDGKLDFIYFYDNKMLVKRGFGDGSFGAAQTITLSEACDRPARNVLFDIDNDGDVDLLCIDSMTARVFKNTSGNSFSNFAPAVVSSLEFNADWYDRAQLIDFNNDGVQDIAFLDTRFYMASWTPLFPYFKNTAYYYVKQGRADGNFDRATRFAPDDNSIAIGAFLNDGFSAFDYFDGSNTPKALTASTDGKLWLSQLNPYLVLVPWPLATSAVAPSSQLARQPATPLWRKNLLNRRVFH